MVFSADEVKSLSHSLWERFEFQPYTENNESGRIIDLARTWVLDNRYYIRLRARDTELKFDYSVEWMMEHEDSTYIVLRLSRWWQRVYGNPEARYVLARVQSPWSIETLSKEVFWDLAPALVADVQGRLHDDRTQEVFDTAQRLFGYCADWGEKEWIEDDLQGLGVTLNLKISECEIEPGIPVKIEEKTIDETGSSVLKLAASTPLFPRLVDSYCVGWLFLNEHSYHLLLIPQSHLQRNSRPELYLCRVSSADELVSMDWEEAVEACWGLVRAVENEVNWTNNDLCQLLGDFDTGDRLQPV